MSRKENRKARLELKFKKKEELAIAKRKLADNIKEIRNQIKIAKQKEITLRAESRKEKIKEKQEYQESVVKDRADFYRQRSLISENKKYLIAKKRELKEKINLAKAHNRQIILKEKENHRQALLIAKQTKREEILKQKRKVEELKREQQQKLIDANQKILEKQNEMQIFHIKQEELIAKKKEELIQKKAKLVADRLEAKQKARERREKKLLEAKMTKVELKELEMQERAKLANLKVTLQEEKDQTEHNQQALLDKETESAAKALVATFEATKHATKKLEELHDEMEAQEESDVQVEQQKIWEEETSVNFENNEWDDTNEERQELVKGVVVQSMGKEAWKIYERSNKPNTKIKLEKIQLNNEDIELIKEFQQLKQEDAITDIREFVKYVAYLTNRSENNLLITNELVAVVVNILQGRTLQFLEGYFTLEKQGPYRVIRYSENLSTVASRVVSLPEEPFFDMLQEVILRKLKKGLVIKVNENIGLKYEDHQVVVMHDLGFLK